MDFDCVQKWELRFHHHLLIRCLKEAIPDMRILDCSAIVKIIRLSDLLVSRLDSHIYILS
jgi:hypothetical protein